MLLSIDGSKIRAVQICMNVNFGRILPIGSNMCSTSFKSTRQEPKLSGKMLYWKFIGAKFHFWANLPQNHLESEISIFHFSWKNKKCPQNWPPTLTYRSRRHSDHWIFGFSVSCSEIWFGNYPVPQSGCTGQGTYLGRSSTLNKSKQVKEF